MQNSAVFAALSDQVAKTIVDFVGEGLQEPELVHPKLFKQKSTTKKFERIQSVAPFGDVPRKGEGEEYSFDQIQPGYSKDITPLEYGLGFQWTQTAMEDDDYEVLSQYSKWLGFSMRVVQEKQAVAIFNNGFSTQTTADGIALFATNHALKRGGTVRNELETSADLSIGSLTQALSDMLTQTKLESGQLVKPQFDLYLVVHPDNEMLAHRLVMSAGLPQSDLNDVNAVKARRNLSVLPWNYISDSDAWFLVAKKSSTHGLVQINRVKPTLNPIGIDWKTGNRIVTLRSRQVWDSFDWRNLFGSPGA